MNPAERPAGAEIRRTAGRSVADELPSRRKALDILRAGIARGPVLITGEPGVGKTWLAGRLALDGPRGLRWAKIDSTPSMDPGAFLRAVGHRLGLDPAATDTLSLSDALGDGAADGHRWGLVLDEAHLAPTETLELLRVLGNALGQAGGFAAMVIVGQTALLRRLRSRTLAGLDARLSARAHLRPFDEDEAASILNGFGSDCDVSDRDIDPRLAEEIPGRLLAVGAGMPSSTPGPQAAGRSGEAVRIDPTPIDRVFGGGTALSLSAGESPPISLGEDSIEVGWEPEEESASEEAEPDRLDDPAAAAIVASSGPEPIDDHYAALQAWDEWARNQGRAGAVEAQARRIPHESRTADDEDSQPGQVRAGSTRHLVRAEGQEPFSPYGKLFS